MAGLLAHRFWRVGLTFPRGNWAPQWSNLTDTLCLQLREQLRIERDNASPNSLFTTGQIPAEPSRTGYTGGRSKIKGDQGGICQERQAAVAAGQCLKLG